MAGQSPAWNNPMTGISVPRYHNQPIPRAGMLLKTLTNKNDIPNKIEKAANVSQMGTLLG